MLFNSFDFVVFYIVVTGLYFLLKHRHRWPLLLGASCLFYMAFIPVYIIILLATIAIDYIAAIQIEDTTNPKKKKLFLILSILSVAGILFVFKYFNFFNQNAAAIAAAFHWNYSIAALNIILPIGLSFHTFQSLSYVIEVYRGAQKAERHLGIYTLYVMYFPQLVAGPIERPQNLLYQFHEEKKFNPEKAASGLLLILWGLFKKVVIADNLAVYVDTIYKTSSHHSSWSLLLATYFFTFQIYCDFSGYSDIARGTSRILGIELMRNFRMPYFSRSFSEFWSRWHISLSTWFRDYVYIPLGGNRVSLTVNCINILIVFLLSGFWHGAKWTFIVWGGLHGLFLIIERLGGVLKQNLLQRLTRMSSRFAVPSLKAVYLLVVFHCVVLAWVFFRADDLNAAKTVLTRIAAFDGTLFIDPNIFQNLCALVFLLVIEALVLSRLGDRLKKLTFVKLGFGAILILGIVLFGADSGSQFIYFQF